jgi:hypothetical protein
MTEKITHSITFEGIEIVTIEYDDGSLWSGLKSAWEAEQAAKENGTIS